MADAPSPVEVVYALPERYWRVELPFVPGMTVEEALVQAAMQDQVPGGLQVDPARLAVFGRAVTPATVLHPGDRVEILRPLLADPKQARRRRAGETRRA